MKAALWTIVGVCLLAAATLLLAGIRSLPWPMTWFQVASNKPFVEVWALFLAPIGGFAAAIGLVLSANASRLSREVAVATQIGTNFQKGVEMLSSDRTSTVKAGLVILEHVSASEPSYIGPSLEVVRYHIAECDREFRDSLKLFYNPPQTQLPALWIKSDRATPEAIFLLKRLQIAQGRPMRRIYIAETYLADVIFSPGDLTWLTFDRLVVNGCSFVGTDFSNSIVNAYIHLGFTMDGCNLTNANLHFLDFSKKQVGPTKPGVVSIKDCVGIETCQINGAPASEWLAEHTPGKMPY